MEEILNVNVGVMGHVDSGKTTIVKLISEVASTACFDKNRQSVERGITIDLGFSSFVMAVSNQKSDCGCIKKIQVTLVDCPGHASLVRTIIGAASIIDMVMLVIDSTKGIQNQTVECFLLAKLVSKKMIVILNKVDLLSLDAIQDKLDHLTKILSALLKHHGFESSHIVMFSAIDPNNCARSVSVDDIQTKIVTTVGIPVRSTSGPFIMAYDHGFSLKGHGTVITGTVLSGTASPGSIIYLVPSHEQIKIKSMQIFKKPVDRVLQGDRCGISVTNVDPKSVERGYAVSSLNVVPRVHAIVVELTVIPAFKKDVYSRSSFQISLGFDVVPAKVILFKPAVSDHFDFLHEYQYLEMLEIKKKDKNTDFNSNKCFALLQFSKPVFAINQEMMVGMRLDVDPEMKKCRFAFSARSLHLFPHNVSLQESLKPLKIYREKCKVGRIDKIVDQNNIIAKDLLSDVSLIDKFKSSSVLLGTHSDDQRMNPIGNIIGTFGQKGRVKINFPDGLPEYYTSKKLCELSQEKLELKIFYKKYLFKSS